MQPVWLAVLAAVVVGAAAQDYGIARCDFSRGGVTGYLRFVEQASGDLEVTVNVTGGLIAGNHGYHVHDYGDISDAAGMAVGNHFVGVCDECRSPGKLQEVGLLDDGKPLVAAADGSALYVYTETVAKVRGANSIVGRAIIIHGDTGNPGARVAQCVIGREYEPDTALMSRPAVKQATCYLQPTNQESSTLAGTVTFTQSNNTLKDGVWVSYSITGAPQGFHPFHVHKWGNIEKPDGTSVAGHFIGDCANCRANISPMEVGNLFNGVGIHVSQTNGEAANQHFDDVIQLQDNVNNIVGRSLIIHDPVNGKRLSQCVIGGAAEAAPVDCVYGVWGVWQPCSDGKETRTRDIESWPSNGGFACKHHVETRPCGEYSAVCALEATQNNRPVHGFLEFSQAPGGNMSVSVFVTRLSNSTHGYHVHTWGDISDPSGMSVAGHFVGDCDDCRPEDKLQEVGLLDDGRLLVARTALGSDGKAKYDFVDDVAKLEGINGIVGRSIIIHGNGFNSGIRVAQCVIGRLGTPSAASPPLAVELATQATCRVKATSNSPFPHTVLGVVNFTQTTTSGAWVSFDIAGLSAGQHAVSIHSVGDVRSEDASSTGSLFVGSCTECRPAASTQAVGALFNGTAINTVDGSASGMMWDQAVALYGTDNVVGRALLIHADATTTSDAIGQCVIGMAPAADPVGCHYSSWSVSPVCTCVNFLLEGCERKSERAVVSQPRNGGALCSATAMSALQACDSSAHGSSKRVSVDLELQGVGVGDILEVEEGGRLQAAIADTAGVPAAHVVNMLAFPPNTPPNTITLRFDLLTSDPATVESAFKQGVQDGTFMSNIAVNNVPTSPRVVTLQSTQVVTPDSGGLAGGEIAIVVVACLVGAGALAFIVWLYCRKTNPKLSSYHNATSAQSPPPAAHADPAEMGMYIQRSNSGRVDVTNPMR